MRYLFNFSFFQIEDEATDHDDDIDQKVEMVFSVDPAALGISHTSASEPSYPSDHLESTKTQHRSRCARAIKTPPPVKQFRILKRLRGDPDRV